MSEAEVKRSLDCPDCGAKVGALHLGGCDVEQCPDTGRQMLSCGCRGHVRKRLPWTGEWPGSLECREFGLYARLDKRRGWVPASVSDPEAQPNISALYSRCAWDAARGRFVAPERGRG